MQQKPRKLEPIPLSRQVICNEIRRVHLPRFVMLTSVIATAYLWTNRLSPIVPIENKHPPLPALTNSFPDSYTSSTNGGVNSHE